MRTPLRRRLSLACGWLADRRVPAPLRAPLYGAYCRLTGADAAEAELPFSGYPSLSAFFVRRLRNGARPIEPSAEALASPCDGVLQQVGAVERGQLLQAKGRAYPVEELLAGAADARELEGGHAWTLYLGARTEEHTSELQ